MSDRSETVATATLLWERRTLEVRCKPNWLGMGEVTHLEISCIQPPRGRLPVTETGYKSRFLYGPESEPITADEIRELVRVWLDEAGRSAAWRAADATERQLNLL